MGPKQIKVYLWYPKIYYCTCCQGVTEFCCLNLSTTSLDGDVIIISYKSRPRKMWSSLVLSCTLIGYSQKWPKARGPSNKDVRSKGGWGVNQCCVLPRTGAGVGNPADVYKQNFWRFESVRTRYNPDVCGREGKGVSSKRTMLDKGGGVQTSVFARPSLIDDP